MNATAPGPLTRQQLINLLSQHKQEWQRLYGIQDITLFGSLARKDATPGSTVDFCVTLKLRNAPDKKRASILTMITSYAPVFCI